MPVGQYGPPNDMFWIAPWNLESYLEGCKVLFEFVLEALQVGMTRLSQAQYNIAARPNWVATSYGGKDLHGASNIVFSNGDLDPWSSGGVHFNISSNGIWAITIADVRVGGVILVFLFLPSVCLLFFQGAHHLDLRAANPADPHSVKVARAFEVANIHMWIASANAKRDQLGDY